VTEWNPFGLSASSLAKTDIDFPAYAPINTTDLPTSSGVRTFDGMKTLTTLAVVLLFATSCGSPSAGTEPTSPKRFAEKYIAAEDKAWGTGDVSELKALEANDISFHMPGLELKGWQAHEDYIVHGRPTVENLKQNWTYLTGEGNHFAMAYESSARLIGDKKTPPADVSNSYLFLFRLRNDKVEEIWVNGSVTKAEVKK
jgi:ketosteroid isomerase-like protein